MIKHWLARQQKNGGWPARLAETALMLGYTLFTFSPLAWVFTMSLKDTATIRGSPYSIPLDPRWTNYSDVWFNSNYEQYFLNSGYAVGLAIAILVLVSSMAAYSFARMPFRGSEAIFLTIFTSIMLPAQVLLIPLFKLLVDYRLINTLTGLALVYVAIQLPMAIYILRSFFAQIPRELAEAARMDGCGEWKIFWRIMLPIATPAISTILIVNFVALWNEFIFAVIFIQDESKRTLPLGVMKFVGDVYEDLGHMAAGLVISLVPVLLLYLFFSEKFIKGMSAGAVKG
jgi:multiple sugar transport system permease protein/raffinose/stachyose/melibiose transport system permease protein